MFKLQSFLKDLLHIRVLTREIITAVDSERNLIIQPCIGMGVFKYVKNSSQHATNESNTYFTITCDNIINTITTSEIVGYEEK